jgi:hypothetical protein
MLHIFMDKGPWFRAKRFGYGAGLPFKWQGWVLFIAHMALIIGLAFMLGDRPIIFVPLMLLVAIAPMPIYAARTEGGWKWRSGETPDR